MNGYKIVIYTIREKVAGDSGYGNEVSETIFEQKVETLDVQAVIAVVNKLPMSRPFLAVVDEIMGATHK